VYWSGPLNGVTLNYRNRSQLTELMLGSMLTRDTRSFMNLSFRSIEKTSATMATRPAASVS
jgi:hypothetical protein